MTSSNKKSRNAPRIAIVGAGLGGLATSLFLHRLNLPVTIYESRSQDASDGGFLALAPNAAYVLDQLGLYEELLTQGFAYEEYYFVSARNCSKIGSIYNGNTEQYGYPALRISRHVLRQTLLKAVLSAGIEVNFDHKLNSIDEKPSEVTLTFSDNKAATCGYLIGCDGIHSRVRRNIFPSAPEPTFSGQVGIGGGQVPRNSVPSSIPQPCLILGANNSFMMMPTAPSGSIVNVSATIETHDRTRDEWAELSADKTQLKKMLVERHCGVDSTWPDVVRKSCEDANTDSLALWPFFKAPTLTSWFSSSGHVILTGDAAHAMPPTGGQGSAMAFEDAASLSLCFAKFKDGDVDISDDLAAWQSRRQERIEKIKKFTTTGGDIRKATGGWVQMLVKEWLMWAFFLWRGKEGGYAWIYDHKEKGVSKVAE